MEVSRVCRKIPIEVMSAQPAIDRSKVYRVGIDVGGTFTDIVALNDETGELISIKVPSTPEKPVNAVLTGLKKLLSRINCADISLIIHATTIATNAIIGQVGLKLPKTALITTEGFRDIIEIGRQNRPKLYDFFIEKPPMLIPRRYRYGIKERIDAKGNVLKPIDTNELKQLALTLKREGIKSVAIAFLNSYINPEHERKAKEIIRDVYPEAYITTSHEISQEHREYERTSTAVINAVLMPIVTSYLKELIDGVSKLNIQAHVYIMQSSGGIISIETAMKKPVLMIESGPSAGIIACSFLAKELDIGNVLSLDIGGTSAKAGAIINGSPEVVSEYEVGGTVHLGRIVKGSGYPVRIPVIDLAECGAGGGTIAWVDQGGALRVGPLSAGAYPGPACYGKGGEYPTVTDANIILGRLNPEYLLGGEMQIYPELSRKAIEDKICKVMKLDLIEATKGIIKIFNSNVTRILSIVSIERGYDPRNFTLVAYGGLGPTHACALADELAIHKVVIPFAPGLFSAYGLLVADFSYELSKPIMKKATEIDPSKIEEVFKSLEAEGVKVFKDTGIPVKRITCTYQLDLRYLGQAYELRIPVTRPFDKAKFEQSIIAFHRKHEAIYGYAADEIVEIVNARLKVVGEIHKPELRPINKKYSENVPSTYRDVFFEEFNEYVKCPVYIREKLGVGFSVEGPAIVEQYDATTVIYPDWRAEIDEFGNLILTKN